MSYSSMVTEVRHQFQETFPKCQAGPSAYLICFPGTLLIPYCGTCYMTLKLLSMGQFLQALKEKSDVFLLIIMSLTLRIVSTKCV